MIKVLFVCHGNICRSTLAEFLMKELVRQAGKEGEILVESKACRTDEIGNDTHPGTKAVLQAHGIPFTRRQARQIQRADYDQFDYIIAMDGENMRDLRRLTNGDPQDKCQLLLTFAGEDREVADPWFTGNFEVTYQDVDKGCRALLQKLIE